MQAEKQSNAEDKCPIICISSSGHGYPSFIKKQNFFNVSVMSKSDMYFLVCWVYQLQLLAKTKIML